MCEKPMAKTYAEAKAMYETSVRTGRLLTIGYQSRWRDDALYLKQCCENGELGDIYYARAIALRRRAVPTWGVFLNEYEQGGGPLIDIGTHALDLTLWMMDNYKPRMVVGTKYKKLGDQKNTANAWGDWDPEKYTVEDSAFGFVVMENGATVSVESSWALNIADPEEASTLLARRQGRCGYARRSPPELRQERQTGHREARFQHRRSSFSFEGTSDDPKDLECHAFYDSVINGTPLRTKPEQAMVVTQILEAIYESAATGKPVYFD